MIVNLIRNISEINLKGVFLVLAHGNMAHLKKRTNIRYMRQFAVKGIKTLKEEKNSIGDEGTFDMLCSKYYEYSVRYCLNKQDRIELEQGFKDELKIDILQLVEKISPLGFKFKFQDEMPNEETREKIEKAIRNEDYLKNKEANPDQYDYDEEENWDDEKEENDDADSKNPKEDSGNKAS